ncbi:MAG: SoxR reducing system RseC family protein [Candidatus Margulisbacteria bacterium]|nr:SoxR reducing system RseC family protein [Candidatus Margulisiibacteriota bacterium]MBU1616865.1 SoxR reducing system RseC family protein [Candidatus Margulisiibacteriota bacterium]MBU1867085.1 SoxR reducing system RseC family protein [Candidatus Margulisiibacteriota bacterium]
MIEIGVVTKIDGELAEIAFQRNPACGKCTACKSMADGTLTATVFNQAGGQIGERVEVEFSDRSFARAALVVFGLPLFFFFLGYYLGQLYYGETGGIVGAIALLVVSLGAVRFIDRLFSKGNLPRIVAICTKRP